MDKRMSKGFNNLTKVGKKNNKKKRKTQDNKRDVASSSTSGLVEHTSASDSNSGENLISNKQQIHRASNYQLGANVRTRSGSNYGKNFEKTGTGKALGTLKENDSIKDLFVEIGNIEKCFQSFDDISKGLRDQHDLIVKHINQSKIYWNELDENAKHEKCTLAESLAKLQLQSPGCSDKVNRQPCIGSDENEIIHKFLRQEQQLVDESLSIDAQWLMIGIEYTVSCRILLESIAICLKYLSSGDGKKSNVEVIKKREQLYEGLMKFDSSFRHLKEVVGKMDAILSNNESTYQFTDPRPFVKEMQSSFDYMAVKQETLVFQLPIIYRRQLKKNVDDVNKLIKMTIDKMKFLTDKLRLVVLEAPPGTRR